MGKLHKILVNKVRRYIRQTCIFSGSVNRLSKNIHTIEMCSLPLTISARSKASPYHRMDPTHPHHPPDIQRQSKQLPLLSPGASNVANSIAARAERPLVCYSDAQSQINTVLSLLILCDPQLTFIIGRGILQMMSGQAFQFCPQTLHILNSFHSKPASSADQF